MDYVPHSNEDREAMLRAIGAASTDELFQDIPVDVRHPHLDLPPGMSEPEVIRHLQALGQQNRNVLEMPSFPRRRLLQPLHSQHRECSHPARRVPDELHALPARTFPRHLAGHVRVSKHGLPAHRHGRGEREYVRRGHCYRRSRAHRLQHHKTIQGNCPRHIPSDDARSLRDLRRGT